MQTRCRSLSAPTRPTKIAPWMTTRVGLKIEASSGRNHPDSVKDLNSPACSILFKPSNAPTTAAKHALPARTLFGSARGRVRGRCEFLVNTDLRTAGSALAPRERMDEALFTPSIGPRFLRFVGRAVMSLLLTPPGRCGPGWVPQVGVSRTAPIISCGLLIRSIGG